MPPNIFFSFWVKRLKYELNTYVLNWETWILNVYTQSPNSIHSILPALYLHDTKTLSPRSCLFCPHNSICIHKMKKKEENQCTKKLHNLELQKLIPSLMESCSWDFFFFFPRNYVQDISVSGMDHSPKICSHTPTKEYVGV